MNKFVSRCLGCSRAQCSISALKPCWLRRSAAKNNGVSIYGYFLSEIGLGETARLLYRAVSTQDVNVSAHSRTIKGRQNESAFESLISQRAQNNVSISVDGLLGFKKLRRQICRANYNIAYPFWELSSLPAGYSSYLREFDEVWAPSRFIFNVFKQAGLANVELVEHPVDVPLIMPTFSICRRRLRIIYYFDFDSFPARKNPEAAICAFKKAFPQDEEVSLTVKVRGDRDLGRRQWLIKEAAADHRIMIVDKTLSRTEMHRMLMEHDVFLSLHRSEGFGLGCAEALAAGKAVIATNYGGSADFITHETGFPVQWQPVSVEKEDYVFAENAIWADPSIDHAAHLLREIYKSPIIAAERAREGFRLLTKKHSSDAVGRKIVKILHERGVLTI